MLLTYNDPGGHASVYGLEILLQPIQLGVSDGTEWPAVFPFTSSRLIRRDQAMSKVGLGVNLHIVSHSGIERIPEVSEALWFGAGHSEVMNVAGEVRLSRNTDGYIIGYVVDRVCRSSIVTYIAMPVSVNFFGGPRTRAGSRTIGFMIPRSYHVWFLWRYRGHLVVELVKQRFIDLEAVGNRSIRQEALNFFLQPVIRIRNVTR
jgi:hypothetical protein